MWSGFSSEIETHPHPDLPRSIVASRMWSGFSSEIETGEIVVEYDSSQRVACGAASRLRLKRPRPHGSRGQTGLVACGAASRLRLKRKLRSPRPRCCSMSHVERLLV